MKRIKRKRAAPGIGDTIACGCGCGGRLTSNDGRGRPRTFLRGHNIRAALQRA